MSVTLSTTSKNAPLLIHDGYSYIINKRNYKIFWKCEHARKFKCRGRLHTDLNNIFIQTVDDHDNHTADTRSGPIREYYDRLRKESEQNQTNLHNILTQTNMGVLGEVCVQFTSNIRRWQQEVSAAPTLSFHPSFIYSRRYLRVSVQTSNCPVEQLS